jgi:uncharacterized protein
MNKLTVIVFFLFVSLSSYGAEIPPKPNYFVNDYAGVLSKQEAIALEKLLGAFEDSTSNQVAIVIETSLDGEEAFTRSVNIAEAWGIGNKNNDNGVLIYLAIREKQIFIQVGKGLEGVLTDALIGRIIDYKIKPHLKKQKYFEGLKQGSVALIEESYNEYKADKSSSAMPLWMVVALIGSIILLIYLLSKLLAKSAPDEIIVRKTNRSEKRERKSPIKSRKFGGGSFGGGGAGSSW